MLLSLIKPLLISITCIPNREMNTIHRVKVQSWPMFDPTFPTSTRRRRLHIYKSPTMDASVPGIDVIVRGWLAHCMYRLRHAPWHFNSTCLRGRKLQSDYRGAAKCHPWENWQGAVNKPTHPRQVLVLFTQRRGTCCEGKVFVIWLNNADYLNNTFTIVWFFLTVLLVYLLTCCWLTFMQTLR